MKRVFEDTVALVISPQDKDWKIVCVTEYRKNGEWMCGMNFITSIKEVLEIAWKEKLSIIPEILLRKNPKK